MKVIIYNQQGEESGEILLPKKIFGVPANLDLVRQVFLSQEANKRKNIAKTKDRSEVRGGGKKPWRQKGTGRARHGSIRSPIWRGGGVTFGPSTERNFKKIIPKKMRRKALLMVLSLKALDKEIRILDQFKIENPKTKIMTQTFKNLFPEEKKSALFVLPEKDINIIKSCNNISKVKTILAKDLNVLDLLNYKYLVMLKDSIKAIEETFLKIQNSNIKKSK